nr:MAG: replication associated protein [Cressdnaviricota sp.]
MCALSAVGSKGEGNTILPPKHPLYKWFWTIPQDCIKQSDLNNLLEQQCSDFCYQIEKGENGYLHYQGQMTLLKRERITGIKKWLPTKTHLEGTINEEAANKYCCKEATRVEGPWTKTSKKAKRPLKLYEPREGWGQEIVALVESEPDDRSIHWFWGEGHIGKTELARYIVAKYKACYVNGKRGDILHTVAENDSNVVIIGLARSSENPPYETMEEVKDALFHSGKYESKTVCRNHPHVIVFANYPPNEEKLSKDRWKVRHIE